MSKQVEKREFKKEVDSLPVIGIFLLIFGVIIIMAIFFTDSFRGKITNLICGLILLACACLAILWSRKSKKEKKE